MIQNTFSDNSSTYGGAVFAENVASVGTTRQSGLTFEKNLFQRNNASEFGGAVLILDSENLTILKDRYHANWASISEGGLALLNVTSGSLTKLQFEHNEAASVPHSLQIHDSPMITINNVQIANQDDSDCAINGNTVCP